MSSSGVMDAVYHVVDAGLSRPKVEPVPRRFKHSLRAGRVRVAKDGSRRESEVPSLLRFLVFVGVLAGLAWGGMMALVTFVEPKPREMVQTLPANRLNR